MGLLQPAATYELCPISQEGSNSFIISSRCAHR
jgi:hypothetical protein